MLVIAYRNNSGFQLGILASKMRGVSLYALNTVRGGIELEVHHSCVLIYIDRMTTNEHVMRFNRAAQQYNTDRYPGRAQCMQKVLELLYPQPEDIILDVGCGPGKQIIELSPWIKYGYGIDPAEEMIRQAEQAGANASNVRFCVGSAESLPHKILQAGITKVFSNYAFHHMSDDQKQISIQNLVSLLPNNGMIVLGDLMFSDDPAEHKSLFDIVGYGPGCDTPAELSLIEDIFYTAGLGTQIHILNPLVAVIAGKKNR